MSSRFFIDRPIFASVISIVTVVIGLVAMKALPIAQFPEITPPVVQIDADYPGASAEIVADSVARPIEVQLAGIDHLLYYDSTSTNDGHVTVKLTFEIGTNIDIAQVQTQNRVKQAEPLIPQEVARQGVTVRKVSPDLLAVVALSSDDPRYDTLFLSNFATLQVLDNIRRVPGIGDAIVFGQQNYSMRLILNPVRMAQLKLTPTDIANIVREQNRDFPAGTIGREPALKGTELTFPVITQGRLTEVKEFEDLIVRVLPDGSMVRLKDVARAEGLLAAATARIGQAAAARFPTISLTGLLGVASPELSGIRKETFGSAEAGLIAPILNARTLGYEQKVAEAQARQVLAQYEQTILVAFKEVEDALVTVRTAMDQNKAQEVQVNALQSALHLAEVRYKGGLSSYLEVLTAKRNLFDAQLALASTRRLHLSSIVQLYKALGGGWTEEGVLR